MTLPVRSSRRSYNRVAISQESPDATDESALDEPLAPMPPAPSVEGGRGDASDSGDGAASSTPMMTPIRDEINVILLDGAQAKFSVKCDPNWTVLQFKSAAETVTKVPPLSQRLIHMGKLLQDEKTLGEMGVDANNKIVHLFPKPNVVVTPSHAGEREDGGSNQTDDAERNGNGGGAHIPQIILDEDEAARRSQILILSSQEIFEAQHRVKLFSFLLLVVSSMELLTLLTLFVGMATGDGSEYGAEMPPGNPTDMPPSSNNQDIRTWQNSDYADVAISAFGFYVALLGIKATTENTLRLAKQYFGCLLLAAIASNCYYFYRNLQEEDKLAEERDETPDQSSGRYTTAFFQILLPIVIWMLCVIRAWQFQLLIREAEGEAEERARGLMADNEAEGDVNAAESSRSLPYGSGESAAGQASAAINDLELQVERGIST